LGMLFMPLFQFVNGFDYRGHAHLVDLESPANAVEQRDGQFAEIDARNDQSRGDDDGGDFGGRGESHQSAADRYPRRMFESYADGLREYEAERREAIKRVTKPGFTVLKRGATYCLCACTHDKVNPPGHGLVESHKHQCTLGIHSPGCQYYPADRADRGVYYNPATDEYYGVGYTQSVFFNSLARNVPLTSSRDTPAARSSEIALEAAHSKYEGLEQKYAELVQQIAQQRAANELDAQLFESYKSEKLHLDALNLANAAQGVAVQQPPAGDVKGVQSAIAVVSKGMKVLGTDSPVVRSASADVYRNGLTDVSYCTSKDRTGQYMHCNDPECKLMHRLCGRVRSRYGCMSHFSPEYRAKHPSVRRCRLDHQDAPFVDRTPCVLSTCTGIRSTPFGQYVCPFEHSPTKHAESASTNSPVDLELLREGCFLITGPEGKYGSTVDVVCRGVVITDRAVTTAHQFVSNPTATYYVHLYDKGKSTRIEVKSADFSERTAGSDVASCPLGKLQSLCNKQHSRQFDCKPLKLAVLAPTAMQLPPAGLLYDAVLHKATPCRFGGGSHDASTAVGHCGSPIVVGAAVAGLHNIGDSQTAANTLNNGYITASAIDAHFTSHRALALKSSGQGASAAAALN
jgi:hypothetical protein